MKRSWRTTGVDDICSSDEEQDTVEDDFMADAIALAEDLAAFREESQCNLRSFSSRCVGTMNIVLVELRQLTSLLEEILPSIQILQLAEPPQEDSPK